MADYYEKRTRVINVDRLVLLDALRDAGVPVPARRPSGGSWSAGPHAVNVTIKTTPTEGSPGVVRDITLEWVETYWVEPDPEPELVASELREAS